MRWKSGCLSLVGFVILVAIGIPVNAGIRASFSLDRCSYGGQKNLPVMLSQLSALQASSLAGGAG